MSEEIQAVPVQDNPDPTKFVEIKDLVIAAKRESDGKLSILVRTGNVDEFAGIMLRVERIFTKHLDMIDFKVAQDHLQEQNIKHKIIGADNKHTFMNFIRKGR